MTYDEFLEGINNPDKIKQIDFYIEGYNHYRNCSIGRYIEKIGYEMLDVNDSNKPIITKKKDKTAPASPIDHIFTKGFSKKRCVVLPDNELSDHLILWAEI